MLFPDKPKKTKKHKLSDDLRFHWGPYDHVYVYLAENEARAFIRDRTDYSGIDRSVVIGKGCYVGIRRFAEWCIKRRYNKYGNLDEMP